MNCHDRKYTAGSFTKNFSWNHSYERLHTAIANGFSGSSDPVTRSDWRKRSGISDGDRQLIPMNFFLYSREGIEDDFILVDQLVDVSMDPYGPQFAQLALFAFHLANSGSWRNSQWSDGRVAGWANELIRDVAWLKDDWAGGAFAEDALSKFIERRIEGEPVTKRKVLTNYRYMLESAGVLVGGELQPIDLRQRWFIDAVQLFWDRQIFDQALPATASRTILEDSLIEHEVYKLLRCDKKQCQAFARAAFGEYSQGQGAERIAQVNTLKGLGLIAA
jgi:hypothetical protein